MRVHPPRRFAYDYSNPERARRERQQIINSLAWLCITGLCAAILALFATKAVAVTVHFARAAWLSDSWMRKVEQYIGQRPTGGLAAVEHFQPTRVHGLLTRHHPLPPLKKHWCSTEGEECYGEVTMEGFEHVLQATPSSASSPCALTPDASFMDIGSGFGRFAMFVRLRTNVSTVTGLERNGCRHSNALHGMTTIEREAPREGYGTGVFKGLRLINADIRDAGVGAATHIFMSIQCWPKDLLHTILAELAPRAPRLRCMIFSAMGVRDILEKTDASALVDAWGTVSAQAPHIPTTWEFTEAVFVSKRAANGASADRSTRARHACARREQGTMVNSSRAAVGHTQLSGRCRSVRDLPTPPKIDIYSIDKVQANKGHVRGEQ